MDEVKSEKEDCANKCCSYSAAEGFQDVEQLSAGTQSVDIVKEELVGDNNLDLNINIFLRESESKCTRAFEDFKSFTQHSFKDIVEVVYSSDKYWSSKDCIKYRHNNLENNQSSSCIKQEVNNTDEEFLEERECESTMDSKRCFQQVNDRENIWSGPDSFSINYCQDSTEDDIEARFTSKFQKNKNPRKRQERRLKINYCKFCDFSTNHATSLKNHINGIHLQQKDFKCDFCDFSTVQKVVLKEHVDAIHFHLKLHKCNMCDFSTARRNYLKHHINGVHLQCKQHKCGMCDYSSTQSNNLKIHIDDVHFQLRKLKCQSCKFSTSKRADLKRHVNAVHLGMKNLKCLFCDYATLRQYNLNCHVKNKHFMLSNQEPEPKCHKCESCDYSTSKKADLTRHVAAVHLKIRDLKCHLCEYATQRRFNLKCHLKRIHFKISKMMDESSNQEAVKSESYVVT